MNATWLQQGGFLFEAAGFRLVVDPYFSDVVERVAGLTRLAPPPLAPEALKPGLVYCTHSHLDHVDPEGLPRLLGLNPDCPVAGPESVVKRCAGLGIAAARIELLKPGMTRRAGPFTLKPTRAFHSDPDATGLILETGDGRTVYLSGDTEWREELPAAVVETAGRAPDVAFVCINGRLGNMDAAGALETVRRTGASTAVPMHYGLFAENTVDPAPFLAACAAAGIRAFAMTPGRTQSI